MQSTPASGAAPRSAPPPQTPLHITTTIEAFLATHPNSLLREDGRTLFDLRETQYALTAEQDRATLHLWSTDLNLVRRVLSVTPRAHTLRLTTQRFGQARPQDLELTPDKHLRTPTSRDTTRQRYLRLLDRVLLRAFPDDRREGFRSAMDLERSFGPAYARGTLTSGQNAWAVIAVNPAESQATIDGILTVGILWLQHCRDHAAPARSRTSPRTPPRPARLYTGLRLIVPRGTAATTLSRLAWLNPRIAKYELFELDEQTEDLTERDPADHGNLTTRLLHAPDTAAALDRFASTIPHLLSLLPPGTRVLGLDGQTYPQPTLPSSPQTAPSHPHLTPTLKTSILSEVEEPASPPDPARNSSQPTSAHSRNTPANPTAPTCELRLRSPTELAFLLHGLEFARIRSSFTGQSFNRRLEITVGSGPAETILIPSTRSHLQELVRHLFDRRRAEPAHTEPPQLTHPSTTQDPLFRTDPERWLESTLRADLPALDPNLQPAPVYTEVPAFTGAGSSLDRGMLDLLAVTRDHRLAVIELKATEDLHLALQGLDYWIRIRHHHLAHPDPASGALPGLSDLQASGYFPQTRLSPEPPHLLLVAPALHIHPATETILRHLDPRVPWTLIALDERWRTHIKPIWRKRHTDIGPH